MLIIFLCLTVFIWRLFPEEHTDYFRASIVLTVRSCESVVNEPCAKFSLFERKKSRGLKNVSDGRGKDHLESNFICVL